jgi:hypothetical protein
MTWLTLWKWTLILGTAGFAILSVVVIIGGALDIRSLFRSLRKQHQQDTGDPSTPQD